MNSVEAATAVVIATPAKKKTIGWRGLMSTSTSINIWGLLLVLAVMASIIAILPLATAFQFGEDEGFEVIKAFMCSKGYKLYSEIWNDQPPVSTVLLTAAFKTWGPTILTARLVAAGFGLLLIGAFYGLVGETASCAEKERFSAMEGSPSSQPSPPGRRRATTPLWTALIATFLLLASPGVLLLSVSVMLEVPAFATALLSAWLMFQWGKRKRVWWLIASGLVMAAALQTKLTAGLLFPAIGIELLLMCGAGGRAKNKQQGARSGGHEALNRELGARSVGASKRGGGCGERGEKTAAPSVAQIFNLLYRRIAFCKTAKKEARSSNALDPNPSRRSAFSRLQIKNLRYGRLHVCVTCAMVWGLSLLATFALIGMTWGKGQLASSWKSHTTSMDVPGMDRPQDHKFEWRMVAEHAECAIAAAAAVIIAIRKKRIREISFPLTLLVTVCVVHAVHRPWWNYYYLHLAIPIAWLAGWTVNEIIDYIFASVPVGAGERAKVLSRAVAREPGRVTHKNKQKPRRLRSSFSFLPSALKSLALCALVALPLGKSERRLESTVKDLRSRPKAADNPIVKELKNNANGGRALVYSESGIYPFHARLSVIPELAIVMPKRFWSRQLSQDQIIELCRKQQVTLIAIPTPSNDARWGSYFGKELLLVARDEKTMLYRRKPYTNGIAP